MLPRARPERRVECETRDSDETGTLATPNVAGLFTVHKYIFKSLYSIFRNALLGFQLLLSLVVQLLLPCKQEFVEEAHRPVSQDQELL